MTDPANSDAALVRETIFCPVHRQRDCSPLLNGCSRVIKAHDELDRLAATAKRADEYKMALTEIKALPYGVATKAREIARAALEDA